LYNGIPDDLPEEGEGEDFGGEGEESPEQVIKSLAAVIKVACQGNPGNLPMILGSLEQTQPELVNMIRQNESQFRELLTQPLTDEDIRLFQRYTQPGGEGAGSFGGSTGGGSGSRGQGQQQGPLGITGAG